MGKVVPTRETSFLILPFEESDLCWKFTLLPDFSNINFISVVSASLRSSMWSPTNSPSYSTVKVTVKQSHYRPGQAQNVLRKLSFPDFVTTAQDGCRLSALCTGRLCPQEIFLVLISVRSSVDPRAIVWSEGFYVNEKFHWHQLGSNQRPSVYNR